MKFCLYIYIYICDNYCESKQIRKIKKMILTPTKKQKYLEFNLIIAKVLLIDFFNFILNFFCFFSHIYLLAVDFLLYLF